MKRMLSVLALLGTFFLLPLMAQAQKHTITINQVEHATIKTDYYDFTSRSFVEVKSGGQVDDGTYLTIQVTPDEGYEATHYIVNGVEKPITSAYGDSETVKGDMTISAKVVAAKPCIVTIIPPTEGGTLTVETGDTFKELKSGDPVNSGTELRMEVKPDDGYDIECWLIDGQQIKPSSSRPKVTYYMVKKDVTVSVKFKSLSAPTLVPVTVVQPEHGTIELHKGPSKDGEVLNSEEGVEPNSQITMVINPNEGYEIDHWLINGAKEDKGGYFPNEKTITISEATTISAVLIESGYLVTYKQPTNGTLTVKTLSPVADVPSGTRLQDGTMLTIQATVNEGCKFKHFLINGSEQIPNDLNNPSMYYSLKADVTIEAVIEQKAAPIEKVQLSVQEEGVGGFATVKYQTPGSTTWERPTEGTNPTLDLPVGTKVRVEATISITGATVAFTHNDNPVAADQLTDEGLTYEFTLEEPANIKVIFTEGAIGFYVYYDCDKHATITGTADGEPFESGAKLAAGAEVVLTVTPEDGYEVKDWLDDDFKLIPGTEGKNPYTFTVDGFAMVFAETQKKTTALIKISSEGPTGCNLETTYLEPGGSGNPLKIFGEKRIPLGSDVTVKAKFTISGDYQVVYTNNGKPVPAEALSEDGFVYTFKANEDADIHAVFSEKPAPAVDYTVTLEASKGGTVTATVDLDPIESGAKVPAGSKVKVIATPDDGYEVDQWFIDDETITTPEAGYYYFTLNKDTKVKVTFRLSVAVEQPTQNQLVAYVTNGGTRLEVAGAAEGAEVRLYDYTGQLLLTSTEHALDISALPAGGYIVLVGNYTTRIVK